MIRTILIAVIACLGLSSAFISSNIIASDLAEISKLTQDLKQLSPSVTRSFSETTCQMISQCCPQIQSTFAAMTLQDKSQEVLEQCFGRKDSANLLSNLRSCAPLTKIKTTLSDPTFSKFAQIISKMNQDSQNKLLIVNTCSDEELYAIVCDSNGFQVQKSCQQKVLQKVAQQGDAIYQDYVQQMKNNLMKVINELQKAFNR
jgi:hypothetical protein